MIPLPTTEDVRTVGQKLYFEYHCFESDDSQDAELWHRSHQLVTVIGFLPNDGWNIPSLNERCECGCSIMYEIEFSDGWKGEAFEDELLDDEDEYFRPDPPNRKVKP